MQPRLVRGLLFVYNGQDTMPKYAAKTDNNQAEIVKTFKAMGCTVQDLSSVGSGCPDLLVGVSGINLLIEVKNPETRGKLEVNQILWHDDWRGQVQVVKSSEHAIKIVNFVRRFHQAIHEEVQ